MGRIEREGEATVSGRFPARLEEGGSRMSNELTRRSFVKWGTATAGAATLAGLTACANSPASSEISLGDTGIESYPGEKGDGQWLTGACMNN